MTKRRKSGQVVGFVVTPQAIADRIDALDNQIAVLDGDIRASTAKAVNAAWRQEWDAFVRRWGVERDSYKDYSSRLFATYVMPRLDAFEKSYQWWARDFEKRSGTAPRVAPKREAQGLFASLVPNGDLLVVGLIVGAAFYYFGGRNSGGR